MSSNEGPLYGISEIVSIACGWAMDLLWIGSDIANKLVQVGTNVDNFPRVFGM
jgi:hypothetical protein